MAKRNRVTPHGDIVAVAERGLFMGNRGGAMHNEREQIITPFVSERWIICLLSFKGRRRPIMQPGLYTELFFLDEATALAAGHRPCFECQRPRAKAFRDAWETAHGPPPGGRRLLVGDMDAVLQRQRLTNAYFKKDRRKQTYQEHLETLPDGAMVVWNNKACLWWGERLFAWTPAGYQESMAVVAPEPVTVLTPPATVGVLAASYVPVVHASAGQG